MTAASSKTGGVSSGQPASPQPDYLAKDYQGFRQLMLDEMSVAFPEWQERHAADIGNILVEILAYAADSLSYYQDSVAAEAYLGTARRRISLRRHARLLDYQLHEGCASRVWLRVGVSAPMTLPRGLRVTCDEPGTLPEGHFRVGAQEGPPADGQAVFETLADALLSPANDQIALHDWGIDGFNLPSGATHAALRGGDGLRTGDVLILAAVNDADRTDPTTGLPGPGDPALRHVVRLDRQPRPFDDPVTGERVVEVSWRPEDALPFPLPVSARSPTGVILSGLAAAWGNIVPAEAGLSLAENTPLILQRGENGVITAALRHSGLIHAVPFDEQAESRRPAAAFLANLPTSAMPALRLEETDAAGRTAVWSARRDLLDSDGFSRDVQVEAESDGTVTLRFGDDVHGRRPAPAARLLARYRVGQGNHNVAAETIRRWQPRETDLAVMSVSNPLAAAGGAPRQAAEGARRDGPLSFRRQRRCVTPADYAKVLSADPRIQAVVSERRWVGGGHTLFLYVQRANGDDADMPFLAALAEMIEPLRLLGGDFALRPPQPAPLHLALRLKIHPPHSPEMVRRAVDNALRQMFRPGRQTFGEPVYLSRVTAAAMAVAGVTDLAVVRFERLGGPPADSLTIGRVDIGASEIARLDPDAPDGSGGILLVTVDLP